jgi:hypothetical protein
MIWLDSLPEVLAPVGLILGLALYAFGVNA